MKVKSFLRPKKLLAVALSLLMIFSALPVISVSAGTAKFATYSLNDILNLTNLPIININVEGGDVDRLVKDNKKNITEFSITNAGDKNITVQYANNPMTIKGRGNSSWTMDTGKKPYNIKFDSKVNLLGLGKNKSWSLIANWLDTTFIRNYIAYKTGALLDTSAMDCELVELCINGTYEGIYLLTEKYGLGDTRVATAGDGYDVDGDGEIAEFLIEADSRAIENNEPNRFQVSSSDTWFVVKDPDEEDLSDTDQCFTDMVAYMNQVDSAIMTRNHYEDYIDVDSLIDVYIVNEVYKNPDFGYGPSEKTGVYSSSFTYKEEGGKLYFGTIWDFDIAMGRFDYNTALEGYRDTIGPEGYLNNASKWIDSLYKDPNFIQKVKERWTQVSPLIWDFYQNEIPVAYNKVKATQALDFQVWGANNIRHPNGWGGDRRADTFENEYNHIMSFIGDRLAWLDSQWLQETTITDNDIYWTRNDVTSTGSYSNLISEGAQYADEALVEGSVPSSILGIYNENASEGINNIYDGGHGLTEVGGTEENTYGTKQVISSDEGVALAQPITITGPATQRYNWHSGKGISAGFGGTTEKITVTTSGRYIYFSSPNQWWFNGGTTYTMGSDTYVYIVDVSANGAVVAYDGSVTIAGGDATIVDTNYSLLTKNSDTSYTLSFSANQQGNSGTTLGGGSAEPITLSAETTTLSIVNRPSNSAFAGDPISVDEVYLNFEGANPASWSVVNKATGQADNGAIVKFKESSMKVTAVSAGTVVITATTASGASDSIEITVTESTGEIVTGEDTSKGLYNSIVGSRGEQTNWATIAGSKVTRFTGYVDISSATYASAANFFLATEDRDALLGGKADYYIYVNGTPYIKAVYGSERIANSDSFASTFTVAADNTGLGSYERYKSSQGYVANISSAAALKGYLKSGANRIDVIVVSDEDTAIIRPYLYSSLSDEVIEDVAVTGVSLNTAAASLYVGESLQLVATVTPDEATDKAVSWTVDRSDIVEVSANGKVTAKAAGTAVVTVTTVDGGFTATATITVSKQAVSVSINGGAESISVSQYGKATLTAAVTPSVSDNSVTWSSSNDSIVSVDANGVVTGNIVGNAVITATSNYDNTVVDTITVYVTKLEYSLSIACKDTKIGLNEVMTLTPIFSVDIPDKSYTWQVTPGTGMGYVSLDVFHPIKAGTVTVKVRSNYNPLITASIEITVDDTYYGLMSIAPVNSIVTVEAGKTAQLAVTYNPTNATNKNLTWQSIHPEFATVDANGVVTGKQTGSALILAVSEDGRRTAAFAVHVTAPPATLVINNGAASADMTDLGTLTLSAQLTNTTYNAVTWSSSDNTVATVNNGVVTALKPGNVTITASYAYDATINDTITVNIAKANVAVAITSAATVKEGGTLNLAATVSPAVYDTSVTWSVANGTGSATIDGNVLTGVSAGTVTVTATSVYDTTKTASYTVEVTAQPAGGDGITIYAPAFSASQTTYPAGAVVYNPADGKYYVYFNANNIAWTNSGAIDGSWTEVKNDLSAITEATPSSWGSGKYGEIHLAENGGFYTPTNAYGADYSVAISWINTPGFWNQVPAEYCQYFNTGTTYVQ